MKMWDRVLAEQILGDCRHEFPNKAMGDWRFTISSVYTQEIHMCLEVPTSTPKVGGTPGAPEG